MIHYLFLRKKPLYCTLTLIAANQNRHSWTLLFHFEDFRTFLLKDGVKIYDSVFVYLFSSCTLEHASFTWLKIKFYKSAARLRAEIFVSLAISFRVFPFASFFMRWTWKVFFRESFFLRMVSTLNVYLRPLTKTTELLSL